LIRSLIATRRAVRQRYELRLPFPVGLSKYGFGYPTKYQSGKGDMT